MDQTKPIKMFANYNDLFSTCMSFFRGDLLDADGGQQAGYSRGLKLNQTTTNEYEPATQLTKRPQDAATANWFLELEARDYMYVALIFFNLILAKHFMTKWLHKSSFLNNWGFREKDRQRIDESAWRLAYYTFSSTWLIYSCFFKHQSQSLFDSNATFSSYSFELTWDQYWICMIECAFYLHSTYALFFDDVWRRDSPMMLLHHLAAIFSFVCLYGTRTHKIGLATVVLRDTCDVLLEAAKIVSCFRIKRGKIVHSVEVAIKYCFSVFTVSFMVNQLYYYPLFCMYHFFNFTKIYRIQTPLWTTQLVCLIIFLVLDLLWSVLIVRLLYRMLFTSGSVDDLREYDADEILEIQQAKRLAEKEAKLASKEA